MKKPPYLKQSDKIGLVSTARKISMEELSRALDVINAWGLEPVLGKSINAEYHQFAGTDALRTSDFQQMLDNSEIKAILCARGGYGTVRIVDRLNFSRFRQNPKWIIGFSDITVLHAHIHSNFGIETIQATMPLSFAKNTAEALQSLKDALFGEDLQYEIPSHPLNKKGSAKGILIGGNLSVLYSISGSVSDIQTKDKILFLEDLDEYLYHVDRMIMQLKRSGKFNDLAGLMVGSMTEMNDNDIPYGETAEEIIHKNLKGFDFPIAFNVLAGHVADNRALYFGRAVSLQVDSDVTSIKFI